MQKINHPIAIFHGIGENCDGTMKYWAEYLGKKLGVYSRCIEYGRGTESIFHDIQTLSEKACDIVNLDENFNNGFNIRSLLRLGFRINIGLILRLRLG